MLLELCKYTFFSIELFILIQKCKLQLFFLNSFHEKKAKKKKNCHCQMSISTVVHKPEQNSADKIQYIFLFLMNFNTAGMHFKLILMAA